ncbi:MAG: adenosylcobalamin-dependent ribonucleoside-diphosphate reductase [Chloroflexi bacterium]|nr:adenosylcobalamin-dependent ribonucleoside-diphosphate reductase [Chloroflexota bacterium]
MATLQLTENAITVLRSRYLLPGEEPEDLLRRVAMAVAAPEKELGRWAGVFYDLMAEGKLLPNSPTLFNAGTGQGTLSACFVIPIEDTMESIMQAATTSAMIQKYGGGIGYSFSRLRSRGGHIATTHGRACGAIAVLKMLSALSDMITQGGKRHGANMGILHVRHPEIMDFIHMKDKDGTAQNFNISVAITDEFMDAVDRDVDWELVDPHTQEVTKTLPARQIWQAIVESAWRTGDPGLFFIDEANRHNPTPHLGDLESTNPCGEVPLLPHEACNLASINLARFVLPVGKDGRFDFPELEKVARIATRFLDDVVTVNQFPSEDVAKAVEQTRKIGLGVMGWHDALVRMGIPYEDPRALELGERVMGAITRVAREVSAELARERGPYPACREATPLRNATRTCIAPTGSISAIAGCSSGIEPVFALAYVKNVLDGKQLREVNPYLEETAKERGFYSSDLMEEVARTGSVQHIASVPEDVKRLFKTALEVSYQAHIAMQAAFQRHTDLAVSKTINMPNNATVADVDSAYRMAYASKCKGITIYRDGSKAAQVLEVPGAKGKESAAPTAGRLVPRERPSVVHGVTERLRTGHGNTYITINFDEQGKPFEVFTALGKAGGCDAANLEAISRLASLALRSGIPATEVVEQLRSITCHPAWDQGVLIKSAPDAVAIALSRHALGKSTEEQRLRESYGEQMALFPKGKAGNGHGQPPCPECGGPVLMQEGCAVCQVCAWNRCGD